MIPPLLDGRCPPNALLPDTTEHCPGRSDAVAEFQKTPIAERSFTKLSGSPDNGLFTRALMFDQLRSIAFGQHDVTAQDYTLSGLDAGTRVVSASAASSAIGSGGGRIAVVIESADGVRNVLTTTVDTRADDVVQFLGGNNAFLAAVTSSASPAPPRRRIGCPGELYYRAELRAPDGSVLASGAVNWDQESSDLRRALHGASAPEGSTLVVHHAEPKNRLKVWSNGVAAASSTQQDRAFRITGDTFVAAPMTEVPTA